MARSPQKAANRHSNRSIATLSITTLLKTGSESSVDRLMKQISTFLGEISDEFKQVVVEALQGLCLKFPQKQAVLMAFLDTMLRDEGGLILPMFNDFVNGVSDNLGGWINDPNGEMMSNQAAIKCWLKDA